MKRLKGGKVKMDKYMSLAVVIAAIVIIAGYIYVNGGGQGATNTISVQGQSTVKTNPDRVSVIIAVETLDNDASNARDENAEKVKNIELALFLLGLDRDDIDTQDFREYPEYEWTDNGRKFKGYKVRQTLKITLEEDDFDLTGEVVDVGIDNEGYINYINFELSEEKQTEAKKLALEQATRDAKEKAEAIASGADKELGKLVSLQASDFYYRPWTLYEYAEAGGDSVSARKAATNIHPGEKNVQASVTAIYKLR